LQACRCEFFVAFLGRPNEQVLPGSHSPFEFRSYEQFTASSNSAILKPIAGAGLPSLLLHVMLQMDKE